MADRMRPPGSAPGVAIVIGAKPPGNSPSGRMPPPGGQSDNGHGAKVSPEEAGVVRENEHCIDCQMYHPDTGECDKVDSTFDPQAGCSEYFLAIEPDEDDQGGPSDDDQDDMGSAAGNGGGGAGDDMS